MKFYIDETGQVWSFEGDGSQDDLITEDLRAMTATEIYTHLNPPPDYTYLESAWRTDEMVLIADQLLRLDDEDPTAFPGTPSQWKAYRVKVRAWIEGADNFPDSAFRPLRPN